MKPDSQHVPEPYEYSRLNWKNEETEHDWYITGDRRDGEGSTAVAIVPGNAMSFPVCCDTARRICACVNVLKGIWSESKRLSRSS